MKTPEERKKNRDSKQDFCEIILGIKKTIWTKKEYEKRRKEALAKAYEYRDFEIQQFTTRSNFMYVIIGFLGVALYNIGEGSQIYLSFVGTVISFLWICMNQGSKYWQENYEFRISYLEDTNFYSTLHLPKAGYSYSPTKIITLISRFTFLCFVAFTFKELLDKNNCVLANITNIDTVAYIVIACITFSLFCLFLFDLSDKCKKCMLKYSLKSWITILVTILTLILTLILILKCFLKLDLLELLKDYHIILAICVGSVIFVVSVIAVIVSYFSIISNHSRFKDGDAKYPRGDEEFIVKPVKKVEVKKKTDNSNSK